MVKEYKKRGIENFELSIKYYIESFDNGNKNHVAEELSELMVCSLEVFISKLVKLPILIQIFVLRSEFYKDAISYYKK